MTVSRDGIVADSNNSAHNCRHCSSPASGSSCAPAAHWCTSQWRSATAACTAGPRSPQLALIRHAQRSHAAGQALRRLELVSGPWVALNDLWCVCGCAVTPVKP